MSSVAVVRLESILDQAIEQAAGVLAAVELVLKAGEDSYPERTLAEAAEIRTQARREMKDLEIIVDSVCTGTIDANDAQRAEELSQMGVFSFDQLTAIQHARQANDDDHVDHLCALHDSRHSLVAVAEANLRALTDMQQVANDLARAHKRGSETAISEEVDDRHREE